MFLENIGASVRLLNKDFMCAVVDSFMSTLCLCNLTVGFLLPDLAKRFLLGCTSFFSKVFGMK